MPVSAQLVKNLDQRHLPIQLDSVSGSSGTNIIGFTAGGGSGFSELNGPTAIFVDLSGNMYIYDSLNYRVQKLVIGEPLAFTVAGGHSSGSTLDRISSGNGVYADNQSNIYVSEYGNHRVTLWANGNTTAGTIVRCSTRVFDSEEKSDLLWNHFRLPVEMEQEMRPINCRIHGASMSTRI